MVTVTKKFQKFQNITIIKTLIKNVFFGELKTRIAIFGDVLVIFYKT